MVVENYNYLNPTELLDLCCSVVQFIVLDCGSIAVEYILRTLSKEIIQRSI